jgi:hypothetical protein
MSGWQVWLPVLLVVALAFAGLLLVLLAPVLALGGLFIGGWEGLLCVLLAPVLALGGLLILVKVVFPDTVESYPDGRLKARGEHDHGDKQGLWTFWYASGQPESQGEFVGGWESGVWTFWHPNGQLKARGEIGDDGLKQGPWQYWDPEGQELTEGESLAGYPRSDREPMRR